jgi:hypothetical protein
MLSGVVWIDLCLQGADLVDMVTDQEVSIWSHHIPLVFDEI